MNLDSKIIVYAGLVVPTLWTILKLEINFMEMIIPIGVVLVAGVTFMDHFIDVKKIKTPPPKQLNFPSRSESNRVVPWEEDEHGVPQPKFVANPHREQQMRGGQ